MPHPELPSTIIVVAEAIADAEHASGLADRVLVEAIDWLEEAHLDHMRCYQGLPANERFLRWASVKTLAKGLRAHGHFDGRPGGPDALAARKALLLVRRDVKTAAAVILIRDTDGDLRRRAGLEQARDERAWPFPIVIGMPHPKRECWVLSGFVPRDDEEQARLEALTKELGFDPCQRSHELDAQSHGVKRDAKRVLELLTDGDRDRELACWQDADLTVLREQGQENGLLGYFEELETILTPAYTRDYR